MVIQKKQRTLIFIGIIVLAAAAVLLDFSPLLVKSGLPVPGFFQRPFRLGLDLQGGAYLVYEADTSQIPAADQASAVEGVRDVIERRVNAFGVAEPVVQTTKASKGWQVIVELAGVKDINQAIKMIGETPLLEFKEANPNPTVSLTPDQQKQLDEYNADARKRADAALAAALKPGADFATLAKQYSEDTSRDQGGDLDFQKRGVFVPDFEKVCFDQLKPGEITKQLATTQFGFHIIKKEEERGSDATLEVRCSHILIKTKTAADIVGPADQWLPTKLTGTQLTRSSVQFNGQLQTPEISLQFNEEGKKLFADITQRNIGKPVAIFLDGNPISTPTVQDAITTGQAVISGNFTVGEAKLLAQRLNAGALPVKINLVAQQTVGATLGNDSVQKSLNAGMVGILFVALFMILFYRLPGITAVAGLAFYSLILLALFKLIPVTLSLAGIAGFILSLGMAVDANVLVFARLREELNSNKPLSLAIDEAFKRAWPSIFDGNVSTLITCFILMGFTTSVVKGFAVTLALGIVTSMFSAMIVTRIILTLLIRFKPLTTPWLFSIRRRDRRAA